MCLTMYIMLNAKSSIYCLLRLFSIIWKVHINPLSPKHNKLCVDKFS